MVRVAPFRQGLEDEDSYLKGALLNGSRGLQNTVPGCVWNKVYGFVWKQRNWLPVVSSRIDEVCIMFIFCCFQNISRESMGNIWVNIGEVKI